MRPSVLLGVIPFALGCAQHATLRAPTLPTDEPLQVRLHQPTAGALNYTLSEPGYVAIFSVTRGHGISLLYPYYDSQVDRRSHAGLNQETLHGGSAGWGYTAGGRNDHRALFGFADAYYVIASKYPLPVDGMLQSPYLLRSLIGADVFRATSFTETWDALESILVAGMPDDSWSSDVYLNWRDPFLSLASWQPPQSIGYCSGSRFFYVSPVLQMECNSGRVAVSNAPVPVPTPLLRKPPEKPRDRDPSIPIDPTVATRTSRSAIRSRQPVGPVEGERSRAQERAPAPARPAEARPAEARPQPPRREPGRSETKRPAEPKDN